MQKQSFQEQTTKDAHCLLVGKTSWKVDQKSLSASQRERNHPVGLRTHHHIDLGFGN
jgi:hypothetical protein